MSRGRWGRWLLGRTGVGLVVLAAALGIAVARRQDARAEALRLSQVPAYRAKNDAEDLELFESAGDQLVRADRALELAPDLEEPHAFRAWIAARLGDLDRASRELDAAGHGLLARRARAFLLFRKGQVEDALALFPKDSSFWPVLDHFELLCADDRPFEEGFPPSPPRWPEWWRTILSQEPGDVRERLTRVELKAPGSIEACTALRARARLDVLEFDDTLAERDLERACAAPPHERALGEPDRAAIRQLLQGSRDLVTVPPLRGAGPVREQQVWGKIGERVRATAFEELNRDEVFDSDEDLDRAERRLRRLDAIVPGDPRTELTLARALERRAQRNEAALRALLGRLAKEEGQGAPERFHELARISLVLGDLDGAKAWLARLGPIAPENLQARLLRAVVDRDGALAAETLGLAGLTDPAQLAAALRAAFALVLERPWDARVELDTLETVAPKKILPHLVALARVKADPAGTLLALVRGGDRVPPDERKTLARAAGLLLSIHPDEVVERLKDAGLNPDEIKTALEWSGAKVEAAEAPGEGQGR